MLEQLVLDFVKPLLGTYEERRAQRQHYVRHGGRAALNVAYLRIYNATINNIIQLNVIKPTAHRGDDKVYSSSLETGRWAENTHPHTGEECLVYFGDRRGRTAKFVVRRQSEGAAHVRR